MLCLGHLRHSCNTCHVDICPGAVASRPRDLATPGSCPPACPGTSAARGASSRQSAAPPARARRSTPRTRAQARATGRPGRCRRLRARRRWLSRGAGSPCTGPCDALYSTRSRPLSTLEAHTAAPTPGDRYIETTAGHTTYSHESCALVLNSSSPSAAPMHCREFRSATLMFVLTHFTTTCGHTRLTAIALVTCSGLPHLVDVPRDAACLADKRISKYLQH
jgi:hypothetical protein